MLSFPDLTPHGVSTPGKGMRYTLVNTQPVIRAIGVSHTACEDEFRRNLRSHSCSVFSFL